MSVFELDLGESRLSLELPESCAAILPAFQPSSRPADPSSAEGRHRLSITEENARYRVEWTDPDSAAAKQRKLPSPELAMLVLEEAIERKVIADAKRLLALHGGAVATPVGACLLLGDSDSGKSSTTFQLLELGAGFLCEEISLCEPETWQVVPYPQTLTLSDSLLSEFTADLEPRGQLHRLLPGIVRYRPDQLPDVGDRSEPIERVLLPRFRAGVPTNLDPLSPDSALTEVLGYAFPPNVDTEVQFDRMIALLERVETLRFTYSSASTARAALAELFGLS